MSNMYIHPIITFDKIIRLLQITSLSLMKLFALQELFGRYHCCEVFFFMKTRLSSHFTARFSTHTTHLILLSF